MYVSRLVYIVCLLEAVLWVQPNFALSNQRDMAKLLQTQTHKLNELAQNAAKDNTIAALQKQLEVVAKMQEMAVHENMQVHNMQTALLDRAARQPSVSRVQRQPQLFIGHDQGGQGDCGDAGKAKGEKGVENGAVPLMSRSQAYAVACCLLAACLNVLMNDSSSLPEANEPAAAAAADSNSSATKRPRDDNDGDDDDDDDAKEVRRGRKHARLGVRVPSPVQFSQANNCHSKHRSESEVCSCAANDSDMSEDAVLCSPTVSLSSDASSPKELLISSPNPVSAVSSVFSTLPPELSGEFEAQHALYFHGIACPSGSSPSVAVLPPVSPVYPSLTVSMFDQMIPTQPQQVAAIDPALLMVEPHTPETSQQDEGFTPSVSSGNGSEVDDAEEADPPQPAPLFGAALESLIQDDFFCSY